MKALILRNNATAGVATSRALVDKGFQVLCVETQAVAHALIRIDTIDLLVMDERVEGQLTHAIALSGERKNPYLSAIMLADDAGPDSDDLYNLIPSLYALVGADVSSSLLGKLAFAAVSNLDQVAARVALHQAVDRAETAQPEEEPPLVLDAAQLAPVDADDEFEDASYADVAIALPELADMVARVGDNDDTQPSDNVDETATPVENIFGTLENRGLDNVEDVILAEVAALVRARYPLGNGTGVQARAS